MEFKLQTHLLSYLLEKHLFHQMISLVPKTLIVNSALDIMVAAWAAKHPLALCFLK